MVATNDRRDAVVSTQQARRILFLGFIVVFTTSATLAGTVVAYNELALRGGLTPVLLGLCSLLASGGASLGYTASGPLADRGLFRGLLTGACVTGSVGALCLTATVSGVIAAGFLLLGVAAGMAGPVTFTAAAWAGSRTREGALVGFISSIDETGAMVGPLIVAGLLAAFGLSHSLVYAAVMLAVVGVLVSLCTPKPTKTSKTPAPKRKGRSEVFSFPEFRNVFLLMVAVTVPYMSFRTLWDAFSRDIGGDNWLVGASYLVGGIAYATFSPLGGFLFAKKSPKRTWPYVLAVVVLYAGYGLVQSPPQMLVLDAAFSLAAALLYPGILLAGSRALPERLRGTGNGVLVGGAALCALPVGPLAGWLYQVTGRTTTFLILAAFAALLVLPGAAHRATKAANDTTR